MIDVKIAAEHDAPLFAKAHEDVFDFAVDPVFLAEFLADPRHHIAIAMDGPVMVGMCSGVHYLHPDKPNSLWINELGVATPWRRQGIATRLIRALCDHGRALGCLEAWVVADPTNEALGFYSSLNVEQTGEYLAMFTFDLRG